MANTANNFVTLKIASFNIAAGRYDRDLLKICSDITQADADILGLQEVDMFVNRSGRIDMAKEIAERSYYPYHAFARAIDHDGGEYGTAVLSKYPIESFEILPLDSNSLPIEMRSVGIAKIDVSGHTVNFINTHTAYESSEAILCHFTQLRTLLSKFDSYIMTGDFNSNDYTLFSMLENSRIANNASNELPSFTPDGKGIDNIVMSKDWTYTTPTLGKEGSSDHRIISAILKKGIE